MREDLANSVQTVVPCNDFVTRFLNERELPREDSDTSGRFWDAPKLAQL